MNTHEQGLDPENQNQEIAPQQPTDSRTSEKIAADMASSLAKPEVDTTEKEEDIHQDIERTLLAESSAKHKIEQDKKRAEAAQTFKELLPLVQNLQRMAASEAGGKALRLVKDKEGELRLQYKKFAGKGDLLKEVNARSGFMKFYDAYKTLAAAGTIPFALVPGPDDKSTEYTLTMTDMVNAFTAVDNQLYAEKHS